MNKKPKFSTWGSTGKGGGLFSFLKGSGSRRGGWGGLFSSLQGGGSWGDRWAGLFSFLQGSGSWGDRWAGLFSSLQGSGSRRGGWAGLFSSLKDRFGQGLAGLGRLFGRAFGGTFGSGGRAFSGAFGMRADRLPRRGSGLMGLADRRHKPSRDELEGAMFRSLTGPSAWGQPLLVSGDQQAFTPRQDAWSQGTYLATPEMARRDPIIYAPWATASTVATYDAYTVRDLYQARQEIDRLIAQQRGGLGGGLAADLPPLGEGGGLRGQVVRTYGMDPANRYDLQYEVVELDQLIPSNTLTGAINPAYPAELQPRDRTRMASQAQIKRIVSEFVPSAYVDEFMTIDRGAPIIGGDLAVESGNGRVLALRMLQEMEPDKYDEYREAVLSRARDLGIEPGAVLGMRQPVLVRRRLSDVDRVAFTREANQEAILSQSAVEVSRQDADLIGDEMIEGLQIGETQTPDEALRSGSNRDFVRAFLSRLPENETAGLVTSGGEISQALINRMKAAIFAKAFPTGGELGARVFESVDSNIKNLTNGIMGAIVQLVKAERLAGSGLRAADLTITADLAAAVQKFAELREKRMSVDEYMRQGKLFGEDLTADQLDILQALEERSRSSKQIREFVTGWADMVERSPDPNQINMFGDPPPSKQELIGRWL